MEVGEIIEDYVELRETLHTKLGECFLKIRAVEVLNYVLSELS